MVKPRLLRRLIGINHDELGPFRQKGNKAVKFFNFELQQLDLMKIDMLYALAQFQSSLCNTTGDCNEASFSSEKRSRGKIKSLLLVQKTPLHSSSRSHSGLKTSKR